MTELNFLIKLLLDSNLDTDTKRLVADRIREVEDSLTRPIGYQVAAQTRQPGLQPQQALSTQRLLAQNPDLAPTPQPIVPIPRGPMDKETGTEIIPTGNGTQGPRKWK